MKDKWINIGYEDDEMKPYVEPPKDSNDPARIGQSCVISAILFPNWFLCCSLCLLSTLFLTFCVRVQKLWSAWVMLGKTLRNL